jgi:transposase
MRVDRTSASCVELGERSIGFDQKHPGRIFLGTRGSSFATVWGVADAYAPLRQENIRLRQQAHYYESLHARAVAKLQALEGIIAALKEKLAEMARRLFGRKSEKRTRAEAWTSTPEQGKRPRGQPRGRPGHGRQPRPNLPVQRLRVDLPGGSPPCGQCGKPYRRNGTARSYVEIVWEVHLYRRFVACQQYEQACSCPQPGLPQRVVAPPPARLLGRGLLSVESIVEGLLRKFLYFMPVERLVAEWRQLGVEISPGTWCGIFQRLVPLLRPLVAALLEACRADRQWLMDETRWEVFVKLEGKGSFRWWLWVAVSPRVKFYLLSPSRGSGVPKKFFGYDPSQGQCEWTGPLMVDRYASYKFLATLLTLAFCWAHVRRDFVEAQAGAGAEQVAWAQGWIERIGGLYQLNTKRVELGQDPQAPKLPAPFVRMDPERLAGVDYQKADQSLRQAVALCHGQWEGELGQERLPIRRRKILESLRTHWSGLTLFVEHPEIPMDNNGSERAIRSGVIGRKNFYGSGSIWSGELLAMMLTILQTGLLHQLNLRGYLIDYLQACAANGGQAPKELEAWLPWNYRPQERALGP